MTKDKETKMGRGNHASDQGTHQKALEVTSPKPASVCPETAWRLTEVEKRLPLKSQQKITHKVSRLRDRQPRGRAIRGDKEAHGSRNDPRSL